MARRKRYSDDDEVNYISDRDRRIRSLLLFGGVFIGLALVILVIAIVLGIVNQPPPVAAPTPTAVAENDEKTAVVYERNTNVTAVVQGALGSGGKFKGSWYELFFTAPTYPEVLAKQNGSLDQFLVNFIDSAQQTVDMAIYDFDLENVADAMKRAVGRGVRVRMVIDSDTINSKDLDVSKALDRIRQAGIPVIADERQGIMHDKFTIVDNKAVATGSWNYTRSETYRNNNNVIYIKVPEIAQNYTQEFERMFSKRLFGPNKDAGSPYQIFNFDSTKIETYFAPQDGVAQKIIDKISAARSTIDFMAFSFTSDPIGQAIIDKAKSGIKVNGVFEAVGASAPSSYFFKMRNLKLDNLQVVSDSDPWIMHHKVIIIDNRLVIFGSYNFSSAAEKVNDENLLIIDDESLAKAFKSEFDKVLSVSKQKLPTK